MKTVSKIALSALLASTLGAGSAHALEAGDKLLYLRIVNIGPDASSSVLNVAGADMAGTGVDVDDATTLDISLGYMVTDGFAVSILLDPSTEHNVDVFGLGGIGVPDGTEVVEAKVLPPTLFLNYYFNSAGSVRPYVGAGVNYTLFFDEGLTNAAKFGLGATNLKMDDSVGAAAQFGVDVDLADGWFFSADVKYIQINTEATFDTALGGVKVDVDIDPWVIGVGLGTTF